MTDRLSNYFDEATRVVLKEGVSSWRALKRHEDWNHWLNVGHAIAAAQDIAVTYANGQTSGKRFNEFMAQCYDSPSYLKTSPTWTSRSAATPRSAGASARPSRSSGRRRRDQGPADEPPQGGVAGVRGEPPTGQREKAGRLAVREDQAGTGVGAGTRAREGEGDRLAEERKGGRVIFTYGTPTTTSPT